MVVPAIFLKSRFFLKSGFLKSRFNSTQFLLTWDLLADKYLHLHLNKYQLNILKLKFKVWYLLLHRSIFFYNLAYTAGWNVWGDWVLVLNHHNHKIWVPSILTHNLWLIFTRMKQKNSKWPTQKKVIFQNRQFSIFFCENLLDWSSFRLFLSLCRTTSLPYRLSYINALRINQFY